MLCRNNKPKFSFNLLQGIKAEKGTFNNHFTRNNCIQCSFELSAHLVGRNYTPVSDTFQLFSQRGLRHTNNRRGDKNNAVVALL